ncbi:hypothetical protein P885DRAFT_33702 [Corynascus similis CBS 632.67]
MAYQSWQDKLWLLCLEYNIKPPSYQIVSDKRGGRTAWSSELEFEKKLKFHARFWYDGNNINNAKEDVAEVALGWLLTNIPVSPASSPSTTSTTATGR